MCMAAPKAAPPPAFYVYSNYMVVVFHIQLRLNGDDWELHQISYDEVFGEQPLPRMSLT